MLSPEIVKFEKTILPGPFDTGILNARTMDSETITFIIPKATMVSIHYADTSPELSPGLDMDNIIACCRRKFEKAPIEKGKVEMNDDDFTIPPG